MKKHVLHSGMVACLICSFAFPRGEGAEVPCAFDDSGRSTGANSSVTTVDEDVAEDTSNPGKAGVVDKKRRRGKGSHGAPVGFPGVVIPNPANIKPLTDTEALPSTRLAYGARFSTRSYAGHREGNIESGRQMWPDVQRREQ